MLGRHMNAKGTNADKPAWLVVPVIAKRATSDRNTHCGTATPRRTGS